MVALKDTLTVEMTVGMTVASMAALLDEMKAVRKVFSMAAPLVAWKGENLVDLKDELRVGATVALMVEKMAVQMVAWMVEKMAD